jgi:hypothetical protein
MTWERVNIITPEMVPEEYPSFHIRMTTALVSSLDFICGFLRPEMVGCDIPNSLLKIVQVRVIVYRHATCKGSVPALVNVVVQHAGVTDLGTAHLEQRHHLANIRRRNVNTQVRRPQIRAMQKLFFNGSMGAVAVRRNTNGFV